MSSKPVTPHSSPPPQEVAATHQALGAQALFWQREPARTTAWFAIHVMLAAVIYLYVHIYSEERQGPFVPWGVVNVLAIVYLIWAI
ncbi:hypothetical protein Tdes44962_MAKER00248 [Teratosphaeria destructans]|uniref:Uncharacterized protein n=1 Tax=Teratosphaeria destructans TaxID=418781 RepID=A0A9W7SVF7_9PEZI|nr:hypothetical protein Tdes44962_MAKER00248 [Teratosphaeria destructans]